jgi:hypothetical protein
MNTNIKKSISRKINTAQYENIVITCDISIDCEIKSEEELNKVQLELIEKIIKDYKQTEKMVLDELVLEEKKAFIEPSQNVVNKKVNFSDDLESEIFG